MESSSNGKVMSGSDGHVSVSSRGSVPERATWGAKAEFVLTCLGFAVGLGNVWRFPYVCYSSGGGAFLIPYVVALVFVGVPLFYLELSFGQFAGRGPITIWAINPMFKGLGISMQIIAICVVCYYNVVVTWCLFYLFASMTKNLPWTYCGNWWNTEACVDQTMNLSAIVDANGTINGKPPATPSSEYFYNNVLQMSSGLDEAGGFVWQLVAVLLLAWFMIFLVLLKGVASVGKVSYFVTIFPYVLMTILLAQASLLDGSLDGVKFYMLPDWDRLGDLDVWGMATTQIFYSLGLSMGSLIAMSSFNKFTNNCLRDAILIPIINCLTSVYAGFVVFMMLGYISKKKNLPIEAVAVQGPGLVFEVYPEGLATLPVAPVWSTLFFFMMSTLGFSSQFSVAECVCSAISDELPVLLKRRNALFLRAGYCAVNFLLGLPLVTRGGFYLFHIVNEYSTGYPLLVTALFEIMAVIWIYDYRKFSEDIEIMLGKKPNNFWIACWVGITPIILIASGVFMAVGQTDLMLGDYVYPAWGTMLAWFIVACPIGAIVVWMIGFLFYAGAAKVCVQANKSLPNWGPVDPENRKGRYVDSQLGDGLDSDLQVSTSSASSDALRPPPCYESVNPDTPNATQHIGLQALGKDNEAFDGGEVVIQIGKTSEIPDQTEAL